MPVAAGSSGVTRTLHDRRSSRGWSSLLIARDRGGGVPRKKARAFADAKRRREQRGEGLEHGTGRAERRSGTAPCRPPSIVFAFGVVRR